MTVPKKKKKQLIKKEYLNNIEKRIDNEMYGIF
jgi:hypothetical protein